MKALIITDIQNDFLPGGALEVPDSGGIISVINDLQSKFELVVATQDWHPSNHISFASNNPGKKTYDKIRVDGIEQILWPDHCVQNSVGANFHPALNTSRVEAIFRKGTNPRIDSYSTFFDNEHLKSTGLAGYFREKETRDLYFCGLAADFCVYYSIIDAITEGFNCYLITDATYPIDKSEYEFKKRKLIEFHVKLVTSTDLFNAGRTIDSFTELST